jgi:hypothetical protein
MAFPDLGAAANSLTKAVNKTLDSSTLAKGVSMGQAGLDALKKSVQGGLGGAINSITGAVPGVDQLLSPFENAKKNLFDLGNLAESALKTKTIVAVSDAPPYPNTLHNYSSYNYIFTLSVLDDASLNFPDLTYRKGLLGPLILKSGAGDPDNRIPTAYKTDANKSGAFDFFLDNLKIRSSIGFDKSTGNTNATGISFKIIEPLSMGLFFQVLQTASMQGGHANYTDVPLLLTIEFKGHVDADLQNVQIDRTTKYIPLKLRTLDMRVSGRGSEYDIAAYPWNERAYSSIYSQFKTEMSIAGKTVGEMLQTGKKSLQAVLNARLAEAVRRKDVNVPDQILISFPKDLATDTSMSTPSENSNTATANPAAGSFDLFAKLKLSESSINKTQVQSEADMNALGRASMGFDLYRSATPPFAEDNLKYNEETGTFNRGSINIDPNLAEFKFAQGSDVTNAINQVILMSDYGRQALNTAQLTKEGMVQWWRIETHLYNIPTDANLAKTGIKPKLIVYRIAPYLVDVSKLLPPNTPKPGTDALKKQAIKEYNYIYTGKNLDIIDFDIKFNAGFYTAMNADGGQNNEGVSEKDTTGAADNKEQDSEWKPPSGGDIKKVATPQTVLKSGILSSTAYKGGGGIDDKASIAARQFHDVVTSMANMIKLNLSILGDPYYLGDSGMGNYTAKSTNYQNLNSDGAMDYQSGEVDIIVNFRTPVDSNMLSGLHDFPGGTKIINQFSGLYQVLQVESTFERGRFRQTLEMARRPNQEVAPSKNGAPPLPVETTDFPPPEGYSDDSADAIASIEAAANEAYPNGAPSLSDQEIAANNAALGNFAG